MKRILIIEDNNDIRSNLEELLELENYQVISAKNGLIGLEKVLSESPDFIMCDISMPEKNGYEVFAILKSSPYHSKIPFIFLTASAQEKDIAKGKKLGVDAYITKPFHTDELLMTIKTLIR